MFLEGLYMFYLWLLWVHTFRSQAWKNYASVQTRMHNICKEVLAPRYADCTLAKSP